jgi:hypothetical protein
MQVASGLGCHFFNASTVTTSSRVDGVHLDRDQHSKLGNALAEVVRLILTPASKTSDRSVRQSSFEDHNHLCTSVTGFEISNSLSDFCQFVTPVNDGRHFPSFDEFGNCDQVRFVIFIRNIKKSWLMNRERMRARMPRASPPSTWLSGAPFTT